MIVPEAEPVRDTVAEQLLQLMGSGDLDHMVVALRNAYPDFRDDVDDAIHEAISRLLQRGAQRQVQHAGAWIYRVASNIVLRAIRDRGRYSDVEPSSVEGQDPAGVAQGRQTLALVRRIVDGWENAHIKVITMLYIEAAWLGEPLSLLEAREHAVAILGEEISIGSIGTWKARGFDRLAEELTNMNYHIKRGKDGTK